MTDTKPEQWLGPWDRGTYAISVSQAQAAAGSVLANGPKRLMGWSLASTAADSFENEGSVTSPGAGAAIVVVTGVPAGDYQVQWSVELAGTLAAADANNFGIRNGAATILVSDNPAVAGVYPQENIVITVTTGNNVSIHNVAAGTVGAIYSGQLTLTPLSAGAIGQLLDGAQIVGLTSTGADQLDTEITTDDGVYVGTSIAVLATVGNLSGCIWVRDSLRRHQEDTPSQQRSSPPR